MIAKYILPLSFFTLLVSLTSCEDFFETTLELDPPPFEKTLVIDCIAHTAQDTIEMRISRNAGILEDIEVNELIVNDAEVFFNINGVNMQAERFTPGFPSQSKNNYRLILPTPLKANDEVSIEVTHKDFEKAAATINILPNIAIQSATFTEDGGLDRDGDERSKVTVTLNDPIGKNYYAVQILAPYWDEEISPTYISSLDPSVFESFEGNTVLLTDDGYDGKEKIIDFQIYRLSKDSAEGNVKLVWYSISEEFYQYSRSLLAHKNTADNPFGTPVPVTTNIKQGTGIFAIHNQQLVDVK
ncbi:MAG: DUF4249 domain-containing protein [Saprospiraceae bacterium]|nr:DUF4249 domain-containing protein [Saprospiraceae bacterium]